MPLNPPDPFTVMAQCAIKNTSFTDCLAFDSIRAFNKTLSNSIGNFHQKILSLSKNWKDLGTNGGGLDLMTLEGYLHPWFDKPVVVEVKNRFNTIKASDEKNVWDKLNEAAKLMKARAYLFQITPKEPVRYNRPWCPSGRSESNRVWCCDGVTAYEMVFGHATALQELYLALPHILRDIKIELGIHEQTNCIPSDNDALKLFYYVFPH